MSHWVSGRRAPTPDGGLTNLTSYGRTQDPARRTLAVSHDFRRGRVASHGDIPTVWLKGVAERLGGRGSQRNYESRSKSTNGPSHDP